MGCCGDDVGVSQHGSTQNGNSSSRPPNNCRADNLIQPDCPQTDVLRVVPHCSVSSRMDSARPL